MSELVRREVDLVSGRAGYAETGEGPVIVAVHGLPGSAKDFSYLAPHLSPRFRLVCLEIPGFGQTPASVAPKTIAGLGDHVLRMMDAIGIERAVVAGYSLGSALAAHAAAFSSRRVAGLALLAPIGLRPHRAYRRIPMPSLLDTALGVPGIALILRALLRAGFRRAGVRSVTGEEAARIVEILAPFSFKEHARRLARVRAPTFAAWTRDDALIEPAIVEEMIAHLPDGPRLRFESGGHYLVKTQAEQIGPALAKWAEPLLGAK
jgi:pimeloyl-ACP methyl ester carboxylesterase